jgi:hypothetical protein
MTTEEEQFKSLQNAFDDESMYLYLICQTLKIKNDKEKRDLLLLYQKVIYNKIQESDNNKKEDLNNLNYILNILDRYCLLHEIMYDENEFNIHHLFKMYYQKILGIEYQIKDDFKNDKKNIPDFMLTKDNKMIPVEIKLHDFDSMALIQLCRYIEVYNCEYGIAVGERCTIKIPNNIKFICINELRKCEVSNNN